MPDSTNSSPTQKILIWLWYWLPPLLLMALIFYVSSQPRLPQAPEPRLDALLKKLAHIGEYTLLYLLFVRAFRRNHELEPAMRLSLLVTTIYAISDEVHQAFVPGRHANWYDVVIDISGGLLLWGLLCSRYWLRRFYTHDHYLPE
ncbi:MAG: VanZ family protein [Chloroflexi bacterium]|nr:VanZ family protein [Chloroflexota bacterium]